MSAAFWKSDLGDITGKAEDAFAKQFKRIPENTKALAKINSFVNAEIKDSGFKFLNIEWVLIDGDFKGQKVQQKLKVFGGDMYDKDPLKTRHKALNMLMLIYQLFNVKPKHGNPPTDQDLAVFIGKEAGLLIRETEPNAEGKQYNWVGEVHSSKGFKSETGTSIVVTHKNPAQSFNGQEPIDSAFNRYNERNPAPMEDDIPF